MKSSFIFLALLAACRNEPPQIPPETKPFARVPEVAVEIPSVSSESIDFPVVLSERIRTDYTMRIITLSPGANSIRIIQPNPGSNYVIERLRLMER